MDVWPRAVVLVLNVVESQTLFPAPSSLPNFRVALKSPSESAGKGVFFLDKNLSWMSHNLKGANRTNASGKVLVVAVLAAGIGEIDMRGHVGGVLSGGPVGEVVGHTIRSK